MSDEFPWDERTILVFYGLPDDECDPEPGTSSFVLDDWEEIDPDNKIFASDGAPYLSVLDREDILETIGTLRGELDWGKYLDKDTARIVRAVAWLDKLKTWIQETSEPWYAFQFEPPQMAGDGTARAKALAAGG